jgi:hypothetical protein
MSKMTYFCKVILIITDKNNKRKQTIKSRKPVLSLQIMAIQFWASIKLRQAC